MCEPGGGGVLLLLYYIVVSFRGIVVVAVAVVVATARPFIKTAKDLLHLDCCLDFIPFNISLLVVKYYYHHRWDTCDTKKDILQNSLHSIL
jgi:hypothetical protein